MAIRTLVLAPAVALAFLLSISSQAHADLNNELKNSFDDMVNVTPAEGYATARRMGVTGGSLVTRNAVYKEPLWNVTPPSIKAGCNGIDLHMGGFSMINTDQAIQAMKTVMSNASTYAFSLALQAMCPTCASEMDKISAKINSWSKQFINSCQAGKSLVNNSPPGKKLIEWGKSGGPADEFFAGINSSLGYATDPYASLAATPKPAEKAITDARADPTNTALNEARQQAEQNATWVAMEKTHMVGGFMSGDTMEFRMQLMNFVGTVIIKMDPVTKQFTPKPISPSISLTDFLDGNVDINGAPNGREITMQRCEADGIVDASGHSECLNLAAPAVLATPFTGVRSRVKDMVFKRIVPKIYYRATQPAYDADEQMFLETASPGITGLVTSMGNNSSAATAALEALAELYALQITKRWMDESMNAIARAYSRVDLVVPGEMTSQYEENRKALDAEYATAIKLVESKMKLINLWATVKANFPSIGKK